MVSSADVLASALDGGSWALGASHACMCSWPAVLPGCRYVTNKLVVTFTRIGVIPAAKRPRDTHFTYHNATAAQTMHYESLICIQSGRKGLNARHIDLRMLALRPVVRRQPAIPLLAKHALHTAGIGQRDTPARHALLPTVPPHWCSAIAALTAYD